MSGALFDTAEMAASALLAVEEIRFGEDGTALALIGGQWLRTKYSRDQLPFVVDRKGTRHPALGLVRWWMRGDFGVRRGTAA